MKRKFIILTLFCILCLSLFHIDINAYNSKKYGAENLDEVSTIETPNRTIYGSYFWYGKIKMNSSLYQKYDTNTDTMYYFIFTETGINGRGHIDHWEWWFKKQFWFNSHIMDIKVDFSIINDSNASNKLTEIDYFPKTTERETTETNSYSFSGSIGGSYSNSGAGINASAEFGFSYSNSTTFADIETKANRLLSPTKDDCSILYTFKNAKEMETRVPYEGEVLRISSFVFRLKNYSTTINNHDLRLKITYDGQIFRASQGEANCEIKKTIEHYYRINKYSISVEQNTDEQKYSYDITNNKKLKDLSDSH